ncbi:hypothetical protein [Dyadobacter psychrotolerans]|uniref:Organic solvent tolerance-like N-terminal domain-containing protein n=1 Tax=Dyadobacter psychrotolerans TaxID=2541721 RepID=A0A4R5DHZ0_9BACT|nr:hypothetical protein [Dyadobacter psychrotolerans]TDE13712.1 hypothetical protein E0F88_17585 [Dyadobacter psychrotolerans]
MKQLTFYLFLVLPLLGNAQNVSNEMKVKNGSDITKTLPYSERFRYSSFLDGKVFFRNGRVVDAKLNYSLAHGEIQFLDAKNDTLILNDKNFMDRIAIAADTFYYYQHHGHVRKVAGYSQVMLAEKQILGTNGTERYAAYNQYSSTTAISTYSSFVNGAGQPQELEGSNKILLKKRFVYFFLDKNRDIYLATKGNLLKVFPRHKKALNEYLKTNNVEFFDPKEIVQTLEFASSL